MASAALGFDIFAKDNASKTFAKVGRSAQGLGNKLEGVSSRSSRTFAKMGRAAQGFGRVLGKVAKVGAIGTAILGGAMLAAAPTVMDMAANIELMGKKANTVFGSQIGKIKAWARENATAMGLTSREATGLAANFADLLIPMGFTRKEAAGMSTDVIGLSGALAEWSGGQRTAAEVSESLAKAMLGEREELKGLGISISEADVSARLMKKGQEELTGAALAQAEALATQELILEKSKDAQAAYAKGSGTLARKLAEGRAGLKSFGETLLVAVTPALKGLADWLSGTVMPKLQTFADWFAGPGKFVVANWFLGFAQGVLRFAGFVTDVFSGLAGFFLGFAKLVLQGAELLSAWIPGLGPQLAAARSQFEAFANGVETTMGNAGAAIDGWDRNLSEMRDEVKLKGDIADLQRKLATARKELKDPNLTKTREAKLRAEIGRLLAGIGRAKEALNAFDGSTATGYLNLVRTITTLGGSGGSTAGLPLPVSERAHGGPVAAGRAYLVGERRAEIFVPRQSGTILPDASAVGAGMPSPREYATALVRELRAAGLTLVAVDSGRRADLLGRAG